MTVRRERPSPDLIFHGDRDVPYAVQAFRNQFAAGTSDKAYPTKAPLQQRCGGELFQLSQM